MITVTRLSQLSLHGKTQTYQRVQMNYGRKRPHYYAFRKFTNSTRDGCPQERSVFNEVLLRQPLNLQKPSKNQRVFFGYSHLRLFWLYHHTVFILFWLYKTEHKSSIGAVLRSSKTKIRYTRCVGCSLHEVFLHNKKFLALRTFSCWLNAFLFVKYTGFLA